MRRPLSGDQRRKLREAILAGFDDGGLRELLAFELNVQLGTIAGPGGLAEVALDVIEWSEQTGTLDALLEAIAKARPQNNLVEGVVRRIQAARATGTPAPDLGAEAATGAGAFALADLRDEEVLLLAAALEPILRRWPIEQSEGPVVLFVDLGAGRRLRGTVNTSALDSKPVVSQFLHALEMVQLLQRRINFLSRQRQRPIADIWYLDPEIEERQKERANELAQVRLALGLFVKESWLE
jgi:hypothetical protein